jgi:hypothetical protein
LSVSWYVLRYSGSTYPAAPFAGVASEPEPVPEPEAEAAIPSSPKPVTFAASVSVSSTTDDRMPPWMIGCSATPKSDHASFRHPKQGGLCK